MPIRAALYARYSTDLQRDSSIEDQLRTCRALESVRDHLLSLHSLRSISRTDAHRKNASAFRLRHSQSLARRRQRLSQAIVRSTTQRLGSTAKPRAVSERLTISTFIFLRIRRKAWQNFGP